MRWKLECKFENCWVIICVCRYIDYSLRRIPFSKGIGFCPKGFGKNLFKVRPNRPALRFVHTNLDTPENLNYPCEFLYKCDGLGPALDKALSIALWTKTLPFQNIQT